jgi:hypothetical protein
VKVPLPVLFAAIAVDALFIFSCAGLVVGTRMMRLRAGRQAERRLVSLRPLLLEMAAEDDLNSDRLRALQKLGPHDWKALAPIAMGLVGQVTGASKEALASLIDAHGSTS